MWTTAYSPTLCCPPIFSLVLSLRYLLLPAVVMSVMLETCPTGPRKLLPSTPRKAPSISVRGVWPFKLINQEWCSEQTEAWSVDAPWLSWRVLARTHTHTHNKTQVSSDCASVCQHQPLPTCCLRPPPVHPPSLYLSSSVLFVSSSLCVGLVTDLENCPTF